MSEKNLNLSPNFFIHFDVASHTIPIEQSIITEQSLKIIVEELGKNLFGENLEIKILVFSDEKGSKLKKFQIVVKILGTTVLTIGGLAWGLLESDIGKAYIKGRTGHEPAYHAEELGKKHRESEILEKVIKNFLEKDSFELENKGITKKEFYKAYNAKNNFYKSCIKNKELKGLGFDNSENFPILPQHFPYKVAELKSEKDTDLIRKIHSLKVVSTINAKENAKDAWRVKNFPKGKSESVYMKDSKFYELYWENDLKIHTILAQVKYEVEENEAGIRKFKDKGKEIEKVFEYDGTEFRSLPKNYQIEPFPLVLNVISNDRKFKTLDKKKNENEQISMF